MIHGRITFVIGIIYIIIGLLYWPSQCTRGMTAPGVYEQKQIKMTGEGPQNYDSWVNQEKRKRERGK